ncbi:hypothetical protein D3C73_911020 [compost metagenome]
MAAPGGGGAPLTVTRSRWGVASGARPRTRTGATTTRAPFCPGESTSITQPSTWVGAMSAGAIGAAAASALSLATASPPPKQASISKTSVAARGRPRARAASQPPNSAAAAIASGQVVGSSPRAK